MPLVSMTGFARSEGEHLDLKWAWELKTVNGRSQDVRLRLPSGFESLDPDVRTEIGRVVKRGNCQVGLQVTRQQQSGELRVNEEALERVLAAVDQISARVGGAAATPDGILALKGVLEIAEPENGDDENANAERRQAIMGSLKSTLTELHRSRCAEGARLADVLVEQLNTIESLTQAARDCPARQPDAIKARLREQLERIVSNSSSFDEDRLHQEAVMLAAKADIQEELDRLFAHVESAREMIAADEPVGRRLDFLTQEFNREANTLCSKSNDKELTKIGLELKTTIDQVREQVQNIE